MFIGNLKETSQYLQDNFPDRYWDCPTGREDLRGIIDVLYAGCFQPEQEDDDSFEVDYIGNISIKDSKEVFANIVDEL